MLDVLLSEDVGVSTECRDPRNGMTALMAAARLATRRASRCWWIAARMSTLGASTDPARWAAGPPPP